MTVIDMWSGLDHKAGMQGTEGLPKYLDKDQARRLKAYQILRAYIETVARNYLNDSTKQPDWREFGDPSLIARRVAGSILGNNPTFGVAGATDPIPDQPDIRPAPEEPQPEDYNDTEYRVRHQIWQQAIQIWEQNATTESENWLQRIQRQATLKERHDWYTDWIEKEAIVAKALENEMTNVVPLGSGLFVLGWDDRAKRPIVDLYEPDVYFPVLTDESRARYPDKIHLAWTFTETDDNGDETKYVRRITYELIEIGSDEANGIDIGTQPPYIESSEAWTHTCLVSDGIWAEDDFDKIDGLTKGVSWQTDVIDGEEIELQRYPIGLDFIPVIHFTNGFATSTHFGYPYFVHLIQLLDEVAAADTDESLAAAWAARHIFAATGFGNEGTFDLTPGQAVKLAENGQIDSVNLGESLPQLGEYVDRRLKRLSVNGSIPEGLVGRVDPSEVPSGITLTISFTSFEQFIENEARESRRLKYELLGKFAQRIAIVRGDETLNGSVEVMPTEINWGTFMPQDTQLVVTMLEVLRRAHLISQETGIKAAQAAVPEIENVHSEFLAVREEMGDKASAIADATGQERYAAKFLRLPNFSAPDGVDEDAPVRPPPGAATP